MTTAASQPSMASPSSTWMNRRAVNRCSSARNRLPRRWAEAGCGEVVGCSVAALTPGPR
ncbi:hypothetical protein [Blastococcus sp. SYSU DS0539]